ncbi:hypothetical protein SNE40_011534 [Patella caerulea]|uniref:Uncharacterized protein n=1 Tax=Patella caerulea TaxID=87958 RepID=A0AAN8JJC8_PATCE
MNRQEKGYAEDLATLAKLDDQILLEEIHERYKRDIIYTYVGDILIAVNPFRDLGIYGKKESEMYKMAKKSANPPHIYAVADMAFQSMIGHGGLMPADQCILISGESGAGKTESTKLIIKQLIELCNGTSQLEQQILQVNPLLEAFGNALTQMNDNSSRFGKYIQLRFQDGKVKGAKISEYLLEKSRVVGQHEEDENFHIFYYLFAGQSLEKSNKFELAATTNYRYLSNGIDSLRNNLPFLQNQYKELINALDLVGFTDEEQLGLFQMVASVLHLGNISFQTNENDVTTVSKADPLNKATDLLSVNKKELSECLTSVITVTKGEYIKINYSKEKAEDCRDALSKAIYGRVFGWIVNKVNQLLAPDYNKNSDVREIGILDIFGFEHFEKNSFEQACINLANEQLQFFFNQHIFKMEQEEYIKEGIGWTEIPFIDNKPLLDLFLVKPLGILALLDEESRFPKATDTTFVEKLNHCISKNDHYQKSQKRSPPCFSINHYAGKVTYDATQWLEKNRDTMPAGIIELLKESKNELVKTLFKAEISRTGTLALQGRRSVRSRNNKSRSRKAPVDISDAKRKVTVGTQFKRSLNMLMEKMTKSSPIFVRCLKPNHNKEANDFNIPYMNQQLLYTGMLQTTKIRREGYAIRPTFQEFVDKYKVLIHKHKLQGTTGNCLDILRSTGMKGYCVGKTKVFLKYYHIEKMADILAKFDTAAIQLQKLARGFLARHECKMRRLVAEQEAKELAALALQIEQQNAALANQEAKQKDLDTKKQAKVKYGGGGIVPPPVPDVPRSKHRSSVGIQSDSSIKTVCTQGTQMEEGDSSGSDDILGDEFVQINRNDKYGKPGTKQATERWFEETQVHQLIDKSGGIFVEWFHGVISRSHAEKLLKHKPVGCFLIRVSESRFGYSLSFRVEDRCRHYMIDQLPNGKFIIVGEKKVHRTLLDLAQYYQENHISNYDGYLTEPCGQETGECDYAGLMTQGVYHILEKEGNGTYYDKVPGGVPRKVPSKTKTETSQYSLARTEESKNRLLRNQQQQHTAHQRYTATQKKSKDYAYVLAK